jgi:membrane protease subunit (stomatin/prohibitin family)
MALVEMKRISEVLSQALRKGLRSAGANTSGRVNRSVVVNFGSRNSHQMARSVQDATKRPTAEEARGERDRGGQ